jgi:hemolysin activation/secretion protein
LDNIVYPRKGIRVVTKVKYVKNPEGSKGYMNVNYNTSFYASVGKLTAAIRPGVAFNIGDDYEFYQANTLGLNKNLRGFRRDRFAGKTVLYNNAELRLKFRNSNGYFLRGDYGFVTFFDNGRVWIPDESSDKWHVGYGAGVFFIPYNMVALTATYGMSKEENIISVKAGFQF